MQLNKFGIPFFQFGSIAYSNPNTAASDFTSFASLCAHLSVNDLIKSVTFNEDGSNSFKIEVKANIGHSWTGDTIRKCAALRLPRFFLFNEYFESEKLGNVSK